MQPQGFQLQTQQVDTTPTRVRALRGFKSRINGESKATYVAPGSVVDVPFTTACELRAGMKALGVEKTQPLHLVTNYEIPNPRARSTKLAGSTREIEELRQQVQALTQELSAVKAQIAPASKPAAAAPTAPPRKET